MDTNRLDELFEVPSHWLALTAFPVNVFVDWHATGMTIGAFKDLLAVPPPPPLPCCVFRATVDDDPPGFQRGFADQGYPVQIHELCNGVVSQAARNELHFAASTPTVVLPMGAQPCPHARHQRRCV